ncbi:MAG: class I poly(R)-hydroxyalkanoic acid synthase [Desulfobulbaceae bacterium]|nr:class I poly(R)-hydroxyalkanoic acid synthase [Desulfobulbaceae bacterium]
MSENKKIADAYTQFLKTINPFEENIPFDFEGLSQSFFKMAVQLSQSDETWAKNLKLSSQYLELIQQTTNKLYNLNTGDVIQPSRSDRRFKDKEWSEQIYFNFIKQAYLITSAWAQDLADETMGLGENEHKKVKFFTRELINSASPANFAVTNPAAIKKAVETQGQSLFKGLQNLATDISEGSIKMTSGDFKVGENIGISPGKVVFQNELIELIQYSPSKDNAYSTPLLIIPPWINKYYILDLTPKNSLIKYLVDNRFTVFVISWKNPDASMRDFGLENYLTLGPLAAIKVVKEITKSEKVNLAGYCLGGTLLSILLAYLAETEDLVVESATFFVTLQDFSEPGELGIFTEESQIALIEKKMAKVGYLPSEMMGGTFNMLRSNDLIWSFVIQNYLMGERPKPFDLLYWNSDSTRMPAKMHSEYLRNMYLENNLIKPGTLKIKGYGIDLSKVKVDSYSVGAENDHIVPWQSAFEVTNLFSGALRFILGNSGHIAGIVSPPTNERAYYYSNSAEGQKDANKWKTGAKRNAGTWWNDWANWLSNRSGDLSQTPNIGNEKYSPICDAPGTYVLEK